MPTYEYSCRACHETFDVYQSMRDAPLSICPKCGQAAVKRLIGRGAGIIFKGSGFYETDYKRPPAKSEGGADSKGDSKPAESSKSATTATASTSNSGSSSAGAAPAKKQ